MTIEILTARALAVLLFLSPVDRPRERLPGWDETNDQRLARYRSIAADVATVALAGCRGDAACARRSVHLLLGVAWHESGFAPDVDAGRCYRGRDGTNHRCDSGLAHSMWQLRPIRCATGPAAPPCDEATRYDHDRQAAAAEALHRIFGSVRACQRVGAPRDHWLAIYAGGSCRGVLAQQRSRELHQAVARAERAPDQP